MEKYLDILFEYRKLIEYSIEGDNEADNKLSAFIKKVVFETVNDFVLFLKDSNETAKVYIFDDKLHNVTRELDLTSFERLIDDFKEIIVPNGSLQYYVVIPSQNKTFQIYYRGQVLEITKF